MKRPTLALVALLAAAVALAACGGGDDGGGEAAADHNEADVAFARGMIPHHRGAVEMARLAATRAQSPEVKELAARIEAAQDPEIATMTGWLNAWGEEVDGGGGHAGMGGTSEGEGMGGTPEEETARLEAASGPEFDRTFLEAMTEHHRGAIEMAETEIAEGRFPDAKALATRIRDSQRAEVEEMERLLAAVPA